MTRHGSRCCKESLPFTDAPLCLADGGNHRHAADAAKNTNPVRSASCGRPLPDRAASATMERQWKTSAKRCRCLSAGICRVGCP